MYVSSRMSQMVDLDLSRYLVGDSLGTLEASVFWFVAGSAVGRPSFSSRDNDFRLVLCETKKAPNDRGLVECTLLV